MVVDVTRRRTPHWRRRRKTSTETRRSRNHKARISGEIIIARPTDVVFDFVADERNEPKYNPDLLHADKVTDGPIDVGTRFAATHTSIGRPMDMTIEVTEYDRPRRMESRTTMSWAVIRGVLTFEPEAAGTRMRWAWDVEPKKFARALGPLVGIIGRRQERVVWQGLKRYLEEPSDRGAQSLPHSPS
jgi:hypothetical protein